MACSMLSVTPLAARGAPARPVLTRKAPRARRAIYATAAFVARPAPAPLPPPPEKATLWHVLPYLAQLACAESRMVLRLSLAMVALLIAKGSGLTAPFFFKRAVDRLVDGATAAASAEACVAGLLLFGLMRLLSQCSKELQMPLFTPIGQAVSRRVSHHTFAHVLDLDISFHLERRTGRLSRILERGTRSTQMLFRAVVFTLLPTALELALVCATLGRLFNPAVVASVAVTFAVYVAWTLKYIELSAKARKSVNELDAQTSGKAVDALLNYETVTLFNNQAQEVSQYDSYLSQYQAAMNNIERLAATLNAGQAAILNVGIVAALVSAVKFTAGGITPGDLILIQGMLLQLWAPLQFLGYFFRELRQSLVDMEDFLAILKRRPANEDGTENLRVLERTSSHATAAAQPRGLDHSHVADDASSASRSATLHAASGAASTSAGPDSASDLEWGHCRSSDEWEAEQALCSPDDGVQGLSIAFENVSFSYTDDRPILRDLTFSVDPGQSVAIVGPSGSGKSTVLKLLARLYRPERGTVRVARQDVAQLRQESLRRRLAVVPQDTVLFNDTILENIRYGRLDASDAEVRAAARMAQLDAAIDRMPEGFATTVGERGLKLSGGEKQRVAIARAFLRNPLLLVCDEATSALDTATEQGIMQSLEALAKGRTSVFVAHRLSTVMACDKIVVLSEGSVAEEGTHAELMACGGVYADMWAMQVGEEERREALEETRRRSLDQELVAV